jgi:hypothetical protein
MIKIVELFEDKFTGRQNVISGLYALYIFLWPYIRQKRKLFGWKETQRKRNKRRAAVIRKCLVSHLFWFFLVAYCKSNLTYYQALLKQRKMPTNPQHKKNKRMFMTNKTKVKNYKSKQLHFFFCLVILFIY